MALAWTEEGGGTATVVAEDRRSAMSRISVPDRTVGDISILQFPFAKYPRSVEPITNAVNRTVDTSPELVAGIARGRRLDDSERAVGYSSLTVKSSP
jgi:hypothetical protein